MSALPGVDTGWSTRVSGNLAQVFERPMVDQFTLFQYNNACRCHKSGQFVDKVFNERVLAFQDGVLCK